MKKYNNLMNLDNLSLFKYCKNNICEENFWKDRTFKYFGKINLEKNQTWKNLYLKLIYYLDKYEYKKDDNSLKWASLNGHLFLF